ncbi:hypothetical protein [Undibacterium sp. Ji22W]|uniref:hypothetical protein n=1 Tax=Undibacterium sp. Ji22W TaxID=3413038 RepID=UPI003BF1DAE5
MTKHWQIIFLVFYLAGCSTTSLDEQGRVVIHNFGYVKIIKPPTYPSEKQITSTGVRLFGFSLGDGFTLGYKENEFIQVPTDCRVLVVVKDKKQLDHMLKEMHLIGEHELCATISPK